MSALTQIKIDAQGLAHMPADSNWKVPKYQRAYKWEKKQVTELFEDIDNAIQDGQTEYWRRTISLSLAKVANGTWRVAEFARDAGVQSLDRFENEKWISYQGPYSSGTLRLALLC